MANNHHPAMVTVSPRVVMVSSLGAMLSSRQDTEVTLHREWQMEDMGNLLQTMAHQLAMDHPRVTVLHKAGMVGLHKADMVGLHKDMVNSPNRATGSLLVQVFVKPGTKGLEQQMAKMQMENTGAGSIVASTNINLGASHCGVSTRNGGQFVCQHLLRGYKICS